jgi:hypothetical protein
MVQHRREAIRRRAVRRDVKPDLCCHRHHDPPAALSAIAIIFVDGPKRGLDSIR